jgi:hypothetical protein
MSREPKILRYGGLGDYGRRGFFFIVEFVTGAYIFGSTKEGGRLYCRWISKSMLAKWNIL